MSQPNASFEAGKLRASRFSEISQRVRGASLPLFFLWQCYLLRDIDCAARLFNLIPSSQFKHSRRNKLTNFSKKGLLKRFAWVSL